MLCSKSDLSCLFVIVTKTIYMSVSKMTVMVKVSLGLGAKRSRSGLVWGNITTFTLDNLRAFYHQVYWQQQKSFSSRRFQNSAFLCWYQIMKNVWFHCWKTLFLFPPRKMLRIVLPQADVGFSSCVFFLFFFYLRASLWTSAKGRAVRCQRPTLSARCPGHQSTQCHLPAEGGDIWAWRESSIFNPVYYRPMSLYIIHLRVFYYKTIFIVEWKTSSTAINISLPSSSH